MSERGAAGAYDLSDLGPTESRAGGASAAAAAAASSSSAPVGDLLSSAATKYGVSPKLLRAVAGVESNLNPRAVSPKGAQGVMQLMPATQSDLGVKHPFNAPENIDAGAKYFKTLLDRFGNVPAAVAAYNWGPENVARAMKEHGAGWLQFAPTETQREVARVRQQVGAGSEQGSTTRGYDLSDLEPGKGKDMAPANAAAATVVPSNADILKKHNRWYWLTHPLPASDPGVARVLNEFDQRRRQQEARAKEAAPVFAGTIGEFYGGPVGGSLLSGLAETATSGSISKGALTGGAWLAVSGISHGVGRLIDEVLPKWSARYALQLKPSSVRYGKTPVETLLNEIKSGDIPKDFNREALSKGVTDRLNVIGQNIDKYVADAAQKGTTVDLTGIVKRLNKEISELDPKLNASAITKMEEFREAIVERAGGMGSLTDVPVDVAQKLKRNIDQLVNFGKTSETENAMNSMGKMARRYIDNALDDAITGYREINQKYSSLAEANNRLSQALLKEQVGKLAPTLVRREAQILLQRIGRLAPWLLVGWPLERAVLDRGR